MAVGRRPHWLEVCCGFVPPPHQVVGPGDLSSGIASAQRPLAELGGRVLGAIWTGHGAGTCSPATPHTCSLAAWLHQGVKRYLADYTDPRLHTGSEDPCRIQSNTMRQ